jgi:hypothetical protein
MPARIIGMIGVTPPQKDATLLVIEGEVSPSFVAEFARVGAPNHCRDGRGCVG